MKSHSAAIAILCSFMAVTQLSGCEVVNSTLPIQAEQIDTSALADKTSFFSTKPSAISLDETDDTITLEYTYGDYFSVSESYSYIKGTLASTKTLVYPGTISKVSDLISYTDNTLTSADLQITLGGFFKWTGDPLIIPGAQHITRNQLETLAGLLKQEVNSEPGIPKEFIPDEATVDESSTGQVTTETVESSEVTITHTDTGIAIKEYSDNILTMDKYAMRVGIGNTKQIIIAQCPAKYVDKLLFISDNPAIATVDSKGNVKGIKNGSATITVTVDGAAGYSSVMIYVY